MTTESEGPLPPCHPGSMEAERRLHMMDEQRRKESETTPMPSREALDAEYDRLLERHGHLLEEDNEDAAD